MKKINIKNLVQSFLLSICLFIVSIGIFSFIVPTSKLLAQQLTQRHNLVGPTSSNNTHIFVCQLSLEEPPEYVSCSALELIHDFFENIYIFFLITIFLSAVCILTIPYLIILTASLYKEAKDLTFKLNKEKILTWAKKFLKITILIFFIFYILTNWDFKILHYLFIEVS